MKIKYSNIPLLLLVMLLLMVTTKAQQPGKSRGRELVAGIKNLQIGDRVPDVLMAKIINNPAAAARTSDFAGRLLILDFWDTSCTACIENMPKLDSLQRKFGEKSVKILSVTWEKKADIVSFFNTSRFLKKQKIPVQRATVVEDRVLGSYFRHRGVPHVVWINKGVVVAITTGQYINEENIQALLDGKVVNWPLKNDSFDAGTPFVALNDAGQYTPGSSFFSYSVLTGQSNAVSGVGDINYVSDPVKHTSRIALFNQTVLGAYRILSFNSDSAGRRFITVPGRIVLEVKDPSKYIFDPEKDSQADWNRNNQLCYEMLVQGAVEKRKMAQMAMKDLDNKLGLHGRWEKRKVKCLVLMKMKNEISPDTVSGGQGGTTTISNIAFSLDFARKYPPVIDETNYRGKIRLGTYDGSLEGLKKALQAQGFDLVEGERELDVLVITELNQQPPKR